jgi:1-acyl-sn-glycerol-3-phosphate acyltransferase
VLGPYFSVDRKNAEKAMKTIEDAKNVMLTKKDSVLLFAEGTRSKDGTVQPFKRGAFNLAVKVKHPVVPVSISGTNKIMQKGSMKIYSGRDIIVHFDKPVSTENINTRQEEIALMEKVREIIIANKVDL